MINQSTYQAAQSVAEKVEKHFAKHIITAQQNGETDLAPQPNKKVIEAIIDAAFWASLRKEEGKSPRISIVYLQPKQTGKPLMFTKRLPLNPTILTKLAPGIERSGIHLGVWEENGELYIWGTTLNIPNFCFVLDVSEPGLLVIKHRRIYGFGKYTNVAVLKGDQIRFIDESRLNDLDCPPIVKSLLDLTVLSSWNDAVNVLIQLAVSMRSHQHGGALLVVPENSTDWKQSIIQPINYALEPAFGGLSHLVKQDGNSMSDIYWQGALRKEVEHLAGLTAVDGATIITNNFDLLAFGAKIGRAKGKDTVNEMVLYEPIADGEAKTLHPSQFGGTRHLSAAQFIHDQHDAMALVASQDGHFTVFNWSDNQQRVVAYRIDALLL